MYIYLRFIRFIFTNPIIISSRDREANIQGIPTNILHRFSFTKHQHNIKDNQCPTKSGEYVGIHSTGTNLS